MLAEQLREIRAKAHRFPLPQSVLLRASPSLRIDRSGVRSPSSQLSSRRSSRIAWTLYRATGARALRITTVEDMDEGWLVYS